MKSFFILGLIFLSRTLQAYDAEFSGNLEGQLRNSKNNPEAKGSPLFQDWGQENFSLLYGNLNGKVKFEDSKIESNLFGRYSQSELYRPEAHPVRGKAPYFVTNIFTFPNTLVARDLFKLSHIEQEGNHKTEAVMNKIYYEKEINSHRLMFGRMYVNYGLGEIFNPINPFNQPTSLTSVSQVAQGNDGISFTYFQSDNHNIQLLVLGDKRINNYNGNIETTFWAHGEYMYNEKLQIDYVVGRDQRRTKVGGQLSHQFEDALVFTQLLYRTKESEQAQGEDLVDAMFGYDEQLSGKWHLRLEAGYQEIDDSSLNSPSFERFLPTEYFIAFANVYELHPLLKVSGTLINDVKSGFSYFIARGTWSLSEGSEVEIFGFSPFTKGDQTDNLAQKLVTTDFGLSLRIFF
jgi:hypothetical protein